MTERVEERLLKFIAGLLAMVMENMWSIVLLVWAATSIFSLDEILYVKKEPTPTATVKKESNDGPKPSF